MQTISPGQLNEAFGKFGITGTTLKAAVRFFVKACTELDIPIAKRFSEKVRASGPRKKRTANGGTKKNEQVPPAPPPQSPPPTTTTWEEQLLGKFPAFDPNWPDPLKEKWFAGFDRLMGSKPA